MVIFLTRRRRTQKKIFNNSFTVPEATYSGGDVSPLIADHFARGRAGLQATGAERVWDEALPSDAISGLE